MHRNWRLLSLVLFEEVYVMVICVASNYTVIGEKRKNNGMV